MRGLFEDSTGKSLENYNFYLSPGDKLTMKIDDNPVQKKIKVTGRGFQNNQTLAIDENDSLSYFYGDTLPARAITYLKTQNKLHKKNLEKYIQRFHPSSDFIVAWRKSLQYEILNNYFSFSTGNAFRIPDISQRTKDKWDSIRKSLFLNAPILNESALVSASYKSFLYIYLIRSKEELWTEYRTHRSDFLLEWYGKDTAAGAQLFEDDMTNDLQLRIIEKNFTGSVKEYMYAVLINSALVDRDFKNLKQIYERFQFQFPASRYQQLFDGRMKEMLSKQERKLTAEMKFIDAGQFKTWEDVLLYFKNKTVLLDMWGTWCGPCRQDIDRHSEFLKAHFKDRGLDFVYIANGDLGHEKLWKDIIAYFNLEGYHILASKTLTKDIMKKVKGQGYPTYVIIHKDGSFEQYERGYGIDREKLIAQIENALKF